MNVPYGQLLVCFKFFLYHNILNSIKYPRTSILFYSIINSFKFYISSYVRYSIHVQRIMTKNTIVAFIICLCYYIISLLNFYLLF